MNSKDAKDICKVIADILDEGVTASDVFTHLWGWLEIRKRYVKVLETGDCTQLKATLMWERLVKMKAEAVEERARQSPPEMPRTLSHKLSVARWYRRMFATEEEAVQMLKAASNAIAAHEMSFQEVP